MTDQNLSNAVITVLSAIITRGFVLIFVEIGNRKIRENDKYRQMMAPFMQKLSAYFRYINWISFRVFNPKEDSNQDKEFKNLLRHELGKYGAHLIVNGGDYNVESFNSKELEDIGNKINNVWYLYDRRNLRHLQFINNTELNHEFVDKELAKLNTSYLSLIDDVYKIAKISGDFYTDFYQPIQYEPFIHENKINLYHKQSILVCVALFLVLFTLCCIICINIPNWLLKMLLVTITFLFGFCLLLLYVDENKQIQFLHQLNKNKKKLSLFLQRLIEYKNKLYKICKNQTVISMYYHKMYL